MGNMKIGYVLVGAAMLVMGLLGVMVKFLPYMPALLLYAIQVVGAVSFFFLVVKTRKFSCRNHLGLIITLVAFGLLADFSFFVAVNLTGVANAAFVKFLAPLFVVFFTAILSEKHGKLSMFVLPLSLAGLFVIMMQTGFRAEANIGVLFALLAAFSFAVYMIIAGRTAKTLDTYTMLFYRYAISAIVLTPVILWSVSEISVNMVFDLALFGILFATLGVVLYVEGARRAGTNMLVYMEPVSAVVYSFFLLSEIPTLFTLVGGALIMAGIYFASQK